MATDVKLGGVVDFQVSANWRLMMQISLDDYHAAAVHPTTFGKDGYLPVNRFHYFRLGPHSTLMMAGDLHLKGMAAACAAGTFSLKKGRESSNKTRFHTRFFLMPFNRPAGLLRRFVRQASIPFVDLFFKHYMQKINKEDNQVCENIQQVSHQINGEMRPSALEERLGWFEDVYAKYVTDRIKQKND
jgi:phenylpropionate dioxygenase-like ring-hydroxylating dioxygenase large terminal subunit